MAGELLQNIKANSGKANMMAMESIEFMIRKIQIILLSTTRDTSKMVFIQALEYNLNKVDFLSNKFKRYTIRKEYSNI